MQPPTSTPSLKSESAPPGTTTADLFAEIVELTRRASSSHGLLTGAFRAVARAFASPYAALYVRHASEVIQDDWHTGPTDPAFWKPGLQAFLTDALTAEGARAKRLVTRRGRIKVAFLSAPILDAGGAEIGAIALVSVVDDESEVVRRLASLEAAAQVVSHAAEMHVRNVEAAPVPKHAAPSLAMARAAKVRSPVELAFSITNSVRNKLSCEQVALGRVNRRRVRILSISGLDLVPRSSPSVRRLRAAMEECLDAETPLIYPQETADTADQVNAGYRLHMQWHAAAKGDAVASIPLYDGDEPIAILSLRRRADQPFTREEIDELRARIEPYAPALCLAERAARGLLRHVYDAVCTGPGQLLRTTPFKTIGLAVLVAAVLAYMAFGTRDFSLTVPCTVTAAQTRHVAAPWHGTLATTTVIEGDRVQKGQVLAELDHAELDLQRSELQAQLAVLEREADRARAARSAVDLKLAQANQKLIRVRLASLDLRVEQGTIRAPIDGVVVYGDLRHRIGSVVERGEPLFQLASVDRCVLDLSVPEADLDELAIGLRGFVATHARPERTRPIRITRIRPAAEVADASNVFIAEAEVEGPFDWTRPGMEGVARIHVGRRRVWWILTHRAIDYLRLTFWL